MDLLSDEEIFAEKMSAIKELQEQLECVTSGKDLAEEEVVQLRTRGAELSTQVYYCRAPLYYNCCGVEYRTRSGMIMLHNHRIVIRFVITMCYCLEI